MKNHRFLIEIPAGSGVKYELDEKTHQLVADRVLYGASVFPTNYGFIEGSRAEDGDPADVVVLTGQPLVPGCVIDGRVIGMLEMEDEAGIDHKYIGVPTEKVDPEYGSYADVGQLPAALVARIKHFFETYKTLEPGKWVKVKSFIGSREARERLKEALT